MTKSIVAPRIPGRRQVAAFALFAFVLLSVSCLRKAATPLRRAAEVSAYITADAGGGGGADRVGLLFKEGLAPASPKESAAQPDRKIIRNASLELLVNDVGQSITKITTLVGGVGGYVEKSTQSNSSGHSANMTVRVPAARLDQVIVDIKRLATTVDRESVEARDVTREYIDLDARLRNAQAEEA